MPCPRRRPGPRCLIALGAALLAPLAWMMLLVVVPTECARQTIQERLARATGRKVGLGRVSLCFCGGVELGDLTIGAPGAKADASPWLVVDRATIDVGPRQLLFGRIEPTRIDVKGARLRVRRLADGRLELADFLRSPAEPPGGTPGPTVEPGDLEVRVADATLAIVDECAGTRLEVTGVEALATRRGRQARVANLRGALNGGTVELAAQLDRSEPAPRFEGQLRVRGAMLGPGMDALGYLVPVLVGTRPELDGRLTLDLYVRGQGASRDGLVASLVGQGRIGLDPVALDGSKLLRGVGNLVSESPGGRVGDVWADLTIRDGRVHSENLTVRAAKVPVVLAGWTDFDGRICYRFKTDGLLERLPAHAQEFLSQLRPELKLNELADVTIEGTVDALSVTAHGLPLSRPAGTSSSPLIGRSGRESLRR